MSSGPSLEVVLRDFERSDSEQAVIIQCCGGGVRACPLLRHA